MPADIHTHIFEESPDYSGAEMAPFDVVGFFSEYTLHDHYCGVCGNVSEFSCDCWLEKLTVDHKEGSKSCVMDCFWRLNGKVIHERLPLY